MRKLSCLFVLTATACVHAPNIVIVDRKTALEQLAAGSYRRLEDELTNTAVTSRPESLTRSELERAGLGDLAIDEADGSESAVLDDWLRRACVGEAIDGTVVVTSEHCTGRIDAAERNRLVERVNRDRFQIWNELQTRSTSKARKPTLDEVRRSWRNAHLRAVVCGTQVQRGDGTWENKAC